MWFCGSKDAGGEKKWPCIMVKSLAVTLTILIVLIVFVALRSGGLGAVIKNGAVQHQQANQSELMGAKQDRISLISFKSRQDNRLVRCGQSISTFDQRIVGGKVATISEFPWMVSLQREKNYWFGFKAFYHSCGASLLTQSWVITAAHCLYNKDEPVRLVAGTDNMNFLYRAQLRSIGRTILHPRFDSATYDNDIALIKVNPPFNLESTFSHLGTVCLERNIPVPPYDIVTITGFGAQAFHKKSQPHLYKADIAVIDQRTCNISFDYEITNNMLCAGGMIAHKRDACSGDSGGPLHMEVNGHMSLVGIVSFGNDCAMEGYPGVYTKVDNYYDWIISQIDEPLREP